MDSYFKKNINFQYNGHELNFRVSQSLFSSQDIDLGTRHLLKTIADTKLQNCRKILDLGCGYGPIGIALKTLYPSSEVHMVDKDALALNYCRQNLEINNLFGVKVYPSLGYDDVKDRDFDLIISNIPAKVGNEVLTHILKDVRYHLKPGGKAAVVVIDAIGDYVNRELSNREIKIDYYKRWPGHLVFHYKFLPCSLNRQKNSFESGIYNRGVKQLPLGTSQALLKTTYNLAEFDTLNFETELLISTLKSLNNKEADTVAVFNPGQGYVPVAISKLLRTKKILLMDRDLQSIRISQKNLIANGYSPNNLATFFQVGITLPEYIPQDYIVGILDDKDNPDTNAIILHQAASQLKKEGCIILASGSTAITRIENLVKKENILRVVSRRRLKGKSSITLRHI